MRRSTALLCIAAMFAAAAVALLAPTVAESMLHAAAVAAEARP